MKVIEVKISNDVNQLTITTAIERLLSKTKHDYMVGQGWGDVECWKNKDLNISNSDLVLVVKIGGKI